MLIHPIAERLRGVGLTAMADAFIEMQNNSAADDLSREDWLGSCSIAKPPAVKTNGSAAGCAMRACGKTRSSRTPTSAHREERAWPRSSLRRSPR